MSLLV